MVKRLDQVQFFICIQMDYATFVNTGIEIDFFYFEANGHYMNTRKAENSIISRYAWRQT